MPAGSELHTTSLPAASARINSRMLITEITQRVVWHASYTPGIKQFRFLTHLGTWAAAAERALSKDFYPDQLLYPDLRPIYMYQVDMSSCRSGIQVQDSPDFGGAEDHIDNNMRFFPKKLRNQLDNASNLAHMQEIFASFGVDYLWYYNTVESPRSKSFVVLNPQCFHIVDGNKVSAFSLLRSDPKLMDNLIRRRVWPQWWKKQIKDNLSAVDV